MSGHDGAPLIDLLVQSFHGHGSARPVGALARGDQAVGSDAAMLRLPGNALMLHVADVGPVTLPVRATQAKRLIAAARPALFGHGEETLSDTSVRDTWELTPDQVILGGSRWDAHLDATLAHFRDELGLPAGSWLRAELLSLLVYGKGQVFLPHQDFAKNAGGKGGWVENGSAADGKDAHGILANFRIDGDGVYVQNLKNAYVYFWRWATWKVWESTTVDPDGDAGVVCFISTAGYLRGPGFKGIRQYLRRHASEGWVIDLTPESQTPDIPTRIFPGVRQPLAIGLFIRRPDAESVVPASIQFRSLAGRQADKFGALAALSLDDDGWRDVRTGWTDPLTPAAASAWDQFPAAGSSRGRPQASHRTAHGSTRRHERC